MPQSSTPIPRSPSPSPHASGTVLVTGAGGFVGSAVVRALVRRLEATARGDTPPAFGDGQPVERVVAMVRPGGSLERLESLGPSRHWAVARANLTHTAELSDVVAQARPRAILHLAMDPETRTELTDAAARRMIDEPLRAMFDGLEGTPGARIITTGSAAVVRPGLAMQEDDPIEAHPAYRHYALAKIREEGLLPLYGERTGVGWLHLRLFYIFGKFEGAQRLLPHIVDQLSKGRPASLSEGGQIRDFTNVDDIANAYVLALGVASDISARSYHIGSGHGISIRDFANMVANVVGRPDLLRFGQTTPPDRDTGAIVADPARARTELGWTASLDTQAQISDVARWWLERLAPRY